MNVPLWAYKAILALLAMLVMILLWRIGKSKHPWQFADMLLTEKNGKPVADRQAFLLLGGFFVLTTWGTYWIASQDELPEWFALLYATYCAGSYGWSRKLKSGAKNANQPAS